MNMVPVSSVRNVSSLCQCDEIKCVYIVCLQQFLYGIEITQL